MFNTQISNMEGFTDDKSIEDHLASSKQEEVKKEKPVFQFTNRTSKNSPAQSGINKQLMQSWQTMAFNQNYKEDEEEEVKGKISEGPNSEEFVP